MGGGEGKGIQLSLNEKPIFVHYFSIEYLPGLHSGWLPWTLTSKAGGVTAS